MAEPMDPVQAMDDDAIDALVADWARSGQRQALQPKERTAEVIEEDRLPSALPVAELPPPEPVSWAVEGLILAGDVNLAVADGGVGKTTLAIVVAGAKTVGSSVFGL